MGTLRLDVADGAGKTPSARLLALMGWPRARGVWRLIARTMNGGL